MTRLRRDPRDERTTTRVEGPSRPRYDRWRRFGAGRPRRDLRAEREGQRVDGRGARPRYDRSRITAGLAARHDPPGSSAASTEIAVEAILVVEEPDFTVAVIPDAPSDRLSEHDRQVLGAARVLAGSNGAVAVIARESCEGCGPAGADRLVVFSASDDYDPDRRADLIEVAIADLAPRQVLLPESLGGGDLARRLAVRMGEPLFANAEVLTANGLLRAARGSRVEQRVAPPRLATVAPDAMAHYSGPPREARRIVQRAPEAAPRSQVILSAVDIAANPDKVPLGLAEFVTSAGNGITDFEAFRRLVKALGATPGASRVLCDSGLMPRHTQVGASGTVLSATCYFALGISGAPQHLQGVAGCEHVVAVNTDLHAAMIERAGLAIVQDAQFVMPALLRLLETDPGNEATESERAPG